MHPRSSLSVGQHEDLVALFEQGVAYRAAASLVGVRTNPSKHLHQRWRLHGRNVLVRRMTNQKHSFEVKLQAVQRFLNGEGTLSELANEYELSSVVLLRTWARIYLAEGEKGLRPKRSPLPPEPVPPQPLSALDKLQKENEPLRAENAYLKKCGP